ncbi:hypothetical protein ACI792_17720 [Blastococcus sp. SYSU DS0669]
MTQYFRLVTAEGRALDCDLSMESVSGRPAVVLESRSGALSSGSARNPDYNDALELLLERLAAAGYNLLEISLESRPAQVLPADQRRLPLRWPLQLRSGMDMRQLRLIIADGQRAVAASPAKTPGTGNANKRIRLVIDGTPSKSRLAVMLGPSTMSDTHNLSAVDAPASERLMCPEPVLPWMTAGGPVLPDLLARAMSGRRLPQAMTDLLPLDPTSPWHSRFPDNWIPAEPVRISNAFAEVLALVNPYEPVLSKRQLSSVRQLPEAVLDDIFERLPLRQRTRKVLLRECSEARRVLPALATLNFGELVALRHFGATSFFDLMTCIDQVLAPLGSPARRTAQADDAADADHGSRLAPQSRVEGGAVSTVVPWGQEGAPVLPSVVRRSLSGVDLPLSLWAALPVDQSSPWETRFERRSEAVDTTLLSAAFSELRAVLRLQEPLLDEGQVATVRGQTALDNRHAFERLPLRNRTRNALLRQFGRAEDILSGLASITVGELFVLRHFGAISFFDLTTALDQELGVGQVVHPLQRATAEPPALAVGVEVPAPRRPVTPAYAPCIRRDDCRFGDLFRGDAETLEDVLRHVEVQIDRWPWINQVVEAVALRVQQRAALSIEELADDILSTALGEQADRWMPVFQRRFGLDGRPPGTLDEAASLIGVTRERVRQVQKRLEGRLPRRAAWAPSLEQALDLLEVITPVTESDAAAAFAAAGLSHRDSWSAHSLVAVSNLFGRDLQLEQDGEWIGTSSELQLVKRIRAAARAVSGFLGAATDAHVVTRLRESAGSPVEAGLVKSVLDRDLSVHWLESGHFWADHPNGRNRLVNVSLRILAAWEPQTLEDMHEGVTRSFSWRASTGGDKFRDLVPPDVAILLEFYRSHPAFRVKDGQIVAATPLPLEALGPEKMTMVGVLRAEVPPALDRNSLIAACVESGMQASTAGILITYAEFVKRFAPNVWGLRGVNLSSEQIARIQAEAKVRSALVDGSRIAGRTVTGRPWFARRITPSFLFSGVMSHDWEKRELDGCQLDLIDGLDGEPVGQLRFANGFNYGYNSWLRKHEAGVGDVIRVTVDKAEEHCVIELGGEEMLSPPFDW